MKKILTTALTLLLTVSLLAGCAGAQVSVAPTQGASETPRETESTQAPSGAVKTGLAVVTSLGGSESASAEADGTAKFDVTLVAVTVDDNGIIDACVIDGIASSVKFDVSGAITSDLTAAPQTKTELGDSYGMKAYGGAKYEWYEQAKALADYAVGKTVEELRSGAVNESGKAADADLASVATISLGGYVSAIEAAADNAVHLGAQKGDRLTLAAINSLDSCKNADSENDGAAQLDVSVTALTMDGDTITSCIIDGLQAAVKFDAAGAITSDVTAAPQTKNQLGENYGMKAWGGAIAEWNEQAASFAAYVTGKTAAEVAGIAVNERTQPTETDLASSVTIAVGGFMALIGKAAA